VLTFDLNKAGERLGIGPLVACLSHYMLWMVMSYLPGDSFWVLEDDAEFVDNWRWEYSEAISVLPNDWDVVFLGSCCASWSDKVWVEKNLAEVRYPMCGHAIMYRKKALATLLRIHQKIWAPLDIAMKFDSLPQLQCYTILPRIVNQRGSYIPE
jgi:GR25 family glycosyltransferase involved in LPS biosynthesis